MSYRAAAGRPIAVQKRPRTLRAVMRRHLREEGKRIADLAPVWAVKPQSAYRIFYSDRVMPPQYVDSFIKELKLDEFDAMELRLLGAIESGWQLHALKQNPAV